MIRIACAAALAVAFAAPASALITMGAITGGTTPGSFLVVAPPPAVGGDQLASPDVFGFVERTNVVLPSNVQTQIGAPLILAGTRVASVGLAFDPANPIELFASGFVTFSRPVFGVITSTTWLKKTDAFLGAPGTVYTSPGARGLDPYDQSGTYLVGNTLFFDWKALSPGDNVRVILSAIPEPTTWVVLIAGFGLVGFAARRRRTAMAA